MEGVNPRNPAQAMGRSRHNKLVYFDGDGVALRGALVQVRAAFRASFSAYASKGWTPAMAARPQLPPWGSLWRPPHISQLLAHAGTVYAQLMHSLRFSWNVVSPRNQSRAVLRCAGRRCMWMRCGPTPSLAGGWTEGPESLGVSL